MYIFLVTFLNEIYTVFAWRSVIGITVESTYSHISNEMEGIRHLFALAKQKRNA